jgi:hypothetical protein
MAHKPPRKHHYIPRFYLDGFASRQPKPRLWVYEKGRDARKSTPKLEGCQRDFYTFEQNGEKDFEFEEWLDIPRPSPTLNSSHTDIRPGIIFRVRGRSAGISTPWSILRISPKLAT